MERFGEWHHCECLTGWTDPDSRADWTFRTIEPGLFYVDVLYSSPVTDQVPLWRLRVGQMDVVFPLHPSGEHPAQDGPIKHTRMRLRPCRVGLVELTSGCRHTLSLAPVEGPFKQVSVEAVALTPAR